MTPIEQKRFDFLKKKYADDKRFTDEKIAFLVRTSLTFDPKTTKFFDGEEKEYQDIDWYYPKGAAFKDAESGSDEGSSDDAGSDDDSSSVTKKNLLEH